MLEGVSFLLPWSPTPFESEPNEPHLCVELLHGIRFLQVDYDRCRMAGDIFSLTSLEVLDISLNHECFLSSPHAIHEPQDAYPFLYHQVRATLNPLRIIHLRSIWPPPHNSSHPKAIPQFIWALAESIDLHLPATRYLRRIVVPSSLREEEAAWWTLFVDVCKTYGVETIFEKDPGAVEERQRRFWSACDQLIDEDERSYSSAEVGFAPDEDLSVPRKLRMRLSQFKAEFRKQAGKVGFGKWAWPRREGWAAAVGKGREIRRGASVQCEVPRIAFLTPCETAKI